MSKLFTACQIFNVIKVQKEMKEVRYKNKVKRCSDIFTFMVFMNRCDSVLVLRSFYWFTNDSSSVWEENTFCFVLDASESPVCFHRLRLIISLVFSFLVRAGICFDKAQLFPQLTGYVFAFNWAPFSSAQMESTW